MPKWLNGWLGGWMTGWPDGQSVEPVKALSVGPIETCPNGWMDDWMAGWMAGWRLDGQMDRVLNQLRPRPWALLKHDWMAGWMAGWPEC